LENKFKVQYMVRRLLAFLWHC